MKSFSSLSSHSNSNYLLQESQILFLEKLKKIREHFEINYVNTYTIGDSKTYYIQPSESECDLDYWFSSKVSEYDETIKSYVDEDHDYSITNAILLEEKYRLEKILSLNSAYEVLNFYKPLVVNDELGIVPGLEKFNPDKEQMEYLLKHFVFRKDYVSQLLYSVEKNLLLIPTKQRSRIKINWNNEAVLLKIMTEFSYLLEEYFYQNEDLNQIEISSIRFKLFEAVGLSDLNYTKGRTEILMRLSDNRFKQMVNLISEVKKINEKKPSRKEIRFKQSK